MTKHRSGYWPSVNRRNVDWASANHGTQPKTPDSFRDESAKMAAERRAAEGPNE